MRKVIKTIYIQPAYSTIKTSSEKLGDYTKYTIFEAQKYSFDTEDLCMDFIENVIQNVFETELSDNMIMIDGHVFDIYNNSLHPVVITSKDLNFNISGTDVYNPLTLFKKLYKLIGLLNIIVEISDKLKGIHNPTSKANLCCDARGGGHNPTYYEIKYRNYYITSISVTISNEDLSVKWSKYNSDDITPWDYDPPIDFETLDEVLANNLREYKSDLYKFCAFYGVTGTFDKILVYENHCYVGDYNTELEDVIVANKFNQILLKLSPDISYKEAIQIMDGCLTAKVETYRDYEDKFYKKQILLDYTKLKNLLNK